MSEEYKAMFEDWKDHSDAFQNLLLDYKDVKMMPWSEIYQRAHGLFKEKVWHQREEENYKDTVEVLKREYNEHLDARTDYRKKFEEWLKAYPAAKKQAIIDEHEQNRSAIYKIYHGIFKDEVWNEYRHAMRQIRKGTFFRE